MIDPSLKVLFCAFQVIPEASGASSRASEFLRALQGKCTVDALTAKSPDVGHIERYFGARLMRVPVGAGDLAARSHAFERAVRRQLDSDEYQIIQVSDPFAGTALLDFKSKLRFKLVYDASAFPSFDLRFTDPHLEGDRSFMAKLKRDELLCLMGADAVLTPSPVTRDHIASLGVPRQKITVIPPAVDLKAYEKFAGARPDRIPMRLLYLGSQVAWQGLPTLLFALKDALKQPAAAGMRLSIVGPRHPDWRDQLEEQVKASGLAGNVDFLDPPSREDLPRLIAQHDVGVAPLEKSERNVQMGGAVMKLAEYAAAGRAIVASDLPVTRALIDERSALFFPPSRESALSAVLVQLAKEPLKRVQMGQASRALALERFDTVRAGEKLLGVYAAFKLRGVSHSGEHEIDAPTSVGGRTEESASRRGFDEPTGVAAMPAAPAEEVPRDAETGQVRLPEPARDAETGQVRLPPEPTPIGPNLVARPATVDEPLAPLSTPAEPLPVAPPAPPEGARTSLFDAPPLFSEEPPLAVPTGELPILQGASSSGVAVVGDLLPDLPPLSAEPPGALPFDLPPPPPPAAPLPNELFGLPAEPPVPAPEPRVPTAPTAARPISDGEFLPPLPRPGTPAPLASKARPPSAATARPPSTPVPVPPVLLPSPPAQASEPRPPSSGSMSRPLPPRAAPPVLSPARPPSTPVPVPPVLSPARPPSTPAPVPPVLAPAGLPPRAPVRPTLPQAVPSPARMTPPPILGAGPPVLAPSPNFRATPPPVLLPSQPVNRAQVPAAPAAPMAVPSAPPPVRAAPVKPPVSEVVELGDGDFSAVEGEPELVEADAVEPLEPLEPAPAAPPVAPEPARPLLQNSVDLGGPDTWVNSLVLGFAPLGQLGAAPVRGSPLSTEPAKP